MYLVTCIYHQVLAQPTVAEIVLWFVKSFGHLWPQRHSRELVPPFIKNFIYHPFRSFQCLSHASPTVVLFLTPGVIIVVYTQVFLYLRRLLYCLITSRLPSVEMKQTNV